VGQADTKAASVGSPSTFPPCSRQLVHKEASSSDSRAEGEVGGTKVFPSHTRVTVIRLQVRVPVLSEQMTLALPRVSTAGRRRMMARFPAIRRTPIASTMVTTAGKPSGIAATARLTEI